MGWRAAARRRAATVAARHLHWLSDLRRRRAGPRLSATGRTPLVAAGAAGDGLATRTARVPCRAVHVPLFADAAARCAAVARRGADLRFWELRERADASRERGALGGVAAGRSFMSGTGRASR